MYDNSKGRKKGAIKSGQTRLAMARDKKFFFLVFFPPHIKPIFSPSLYFFQLLVQREKKRERNLIGLKSYNNITATPYWPQEKRIIILINN
jgi:hypothetical protein